MKSYDIAKMYEWPLPVRAVVLAFVSFIILLLGYYLDIAPYQASISKNISQHEDLKRQLQSMINQQITMKNDIAQLATVKALLLKWQQNIFTKEELPDVLEAILKTGQNNGLKIIAFNPSGEIKDGIYYKTPVSIDMTGTFNQIATFISQLANNPKIINIDSFTISNQQKDITSLDNNQLEDSNTILGAELNIEIYRR